MRGLAAALVALLVGGSTYAADPPSFHIKLLTTRLESVRAHEPGREDLAAQTIAEWSNRELKTLWLDVQMLVRFVRCRSCGETKLPELGSTTRLAVVRYTNGEVRALRAMADEIRVRADRGERLLKRAAVL